MFEILTSNALVLKTLQSQPVALTLPLIHWLLIQANLSTFVAAFPLLAYCVVIPLLRFDPTVPLHPALACTWVFIFLRLSDVSLLDRNILQKLSFYQYVEYVGAFRLPAEKDKDKAKSAHKLTTEKKKVSAIDSKTVPYEQILSRSYALRVILDAALKSLFFYFSLMHWKNTRANFQPKLFSIIDFSDLVLARDYLLLGFSVMFALDISITIGNHALALFFKVPYVPIMNAPYLATSVRDFWVRWNLIVQRGLRRIVFDPVVYACGYGHDVQKTGKKIPASVMALAGFATFAFSGLMHEWMIYAMTLGSTYEQMAYFCLQGVLALLEIIVLRTVKAATGIDIGKVVPWPFQVLYTILIGLVFAPLFHNPFIRENLFAKMATPPF
ncbi:hypothetical protein HDU91_007300 [Kappamyces sp. JEL0680]|nr:hypothetical protein HDU91_007300 [Kappamyces sp. JEL0680]